MTHLKRRHLIAIGIGALSMTLLNKFISESSSGNQRMPALFVGHGSPMNIVDDNQFTRAFVEIGNSLPKPKAILVVSAHWLTSGTYVQNSPTPKTIYDFGGFPEELYRIKYQVNGAPEMAQLISSKIPAVKEVDDWGIDHGTWSVLIHMFPNQDIPVFQFSLNTSLSFKEHFELGKEIQFLRDRGVLIIGSGNVVHNLRQIKRDSSAEPYDWNLEFDKKITEFIMSGNYSGVVEIQKASGELFKMAHPSYDHFLPLLYTLGVAVQNEQPKVVSQGTQNGSISMTSYQFS